MKNVPAANNALETYYSTRLKTHQKKVLRIKKGINTHVKPENIVFSLEHSVFGSFPG